MEGHCAILTLLIRQPNVDLNVKRMCQSTPLHDACQFGQLECVRVLVQQPSVRLNALQEYGYTPLRVAFTGGHAHVVTYLLLRRARLWLRPPLIRRHASVFCRVMV